MVKQSGKAAEKAKGGKRLKVKKQPLKDLEARKQVKGGTITLKKARVVDA